MPAPVASLGLNQLRKIDRFNAKRRKTAQKWDEWCQANGYTPAKVLQDSLPVFLRYPLLVEQEKKEAESTGRIQSVEQKLALSQKEGESAVEVERLLRDRAAVEVAYGQKLLSMAEQLQSAEASL